MTHAEYIEWWAYDAIEPFGDRRGDIQSAVIAAASQAPHVKGNTDINDFIIFKEDRFDQPSEEDEEVMLDRILDRAARASASFDGNA